MNMPKDSLLLIDGHAVLYRAFHATPPLRTKDGTPTNAVYGFITTLLKALDEINPKYVAVAFDLSGPTFRHEAFEGYKASRKPTPEDLKTQVPFAYEAAKSLNIPIFTKEGFEADDVIGTLATQAKKDNVPVVIVTGDKDSFQLVDDATFVYTMRRTLADTVLYDADGVKERMGVRPDQVTEYKALAGDSSDEIPGIAGIGEKTAVTILSHVDSIDDLYEKLKKDSSFDLGITDKVKQKIIDGEASARQSKELATIHRNVPIELKIKDCVMHEYDATHAAQLFQKLEFYSLVKRLPQSSLEASVKEVKARDWKHDCVCAKADLEAMINTLSTAEYLAVDTETNDLYGPIVGISLAGDSKKGYYIPLIKEHDAELSKKEIGELLKPLLENPNIKKVGHNIKYDAHTLRQLDIMLQPIAFDTMVAAYVLHAHYRTFDFDTVAIRELGYETIPFTSLGVDKKTMDLAPVEKHKLAEYAAEDAVITFRLFEHFSKELQAEKKLQYVAEEIDFPLIAVLQAMEEQGICVDKQHLENLEKTIQKEIDTTRASIEKYAKEPININSPAQLSKLLFEDLGLSKDGIKTTTGGMSTAAAELEKLQGIHPVIDDILKYRELSKLQSTYVLTLPKLIDNTGRIHTVFSQTVAATGRLSSNEPNLQNIPIRSELGNEIRKAFIAPKGFKMLSLDYSQIELRVIAHLSQDPKLIQVFKDGRDIHDEVSKALNVDRRAAKAINFGIIYGLSAFGLSQGLKIDPKIAKEYIDAYFAAYPKLHKYLQDTRAEIKEKGYVETLYGRKREIPEIHAANAIVRAAAERQAINAPAQGTAADIMKLAMIRTHNWLEQTYAGKDDRPYLILQVHDELLLEASEADAEKIADKVKEIMESIDGLDVPLVAEKAIGDTWGQLK